MIMKGFVNFIREQGVVGLAVGFVLGGAVSKVVSAFVTDIVNPILNIFFIAVGGLKTAYVTIGPSKIMYGDMISAIVDFVVLALVVYFALKMIGFDKIDKKKS